MTDTDKPDEPATMSNWAAQANAYAARKQALFPENRAAVFDALERSGIEIVTVTFDGYGDSGQIDNVEVTPDTAPGLAAIEIEQKRADWHADAIETVTVALRAAIEDIGYELLERSHCGWEINEGGFGEFVFDVPARAIRLDYNQRYAGSEPYAHEF